MKKLYSTLLIALILIISLGGINSVKAQNVLDGIYQPEHAPVRKPIPYYYLREADVMWSKKIIRILDLRQKINLPLYYPTEHFGDRYSLTDLLVWGVENEGIIVYDPDEGLNEPFSVPISLKQINENLGARIDTQMVEDPMTGEIKQKIIPEERKSWEVTRYLMREVWYFDKQRSMLQVRIVGLCPIRMYEKEVDSGDFGDDMGNSGGEKDLTAKLVFWAYYPSYRNIFANHIVFNERNDSEYRTFEDIFSMRKFASNIYREANVYDNRILRDYVKGWDVLLEGQKIQEWIRNYEHDLWEY